MAPFPWLPMLAISTSLISHSYCLTSLFPYVGYMVQRMGVTDDKDAAGFYAGFISSAFMVGRFSSSYFWGRFSDKYGRLPVLFIALWTIVIMSIGFGMSTNIYWAVACRLVLGAFNGIVATSKTMISEICGPEHEVVGMSFVTATWSIGFVIGPGFGGMLAEPATHYPRFFSQTGIFGRYPYLFPNLVGAGLALLALPLTYMFLHETHHAGDAVAKMAGFKPLSTSEVETDVAADAAEKGQREMVCSERYPLKLASPGDIANYSEGVSQSVLQSGKKSNESIGSSLTASSHTTGVTSLSDDELDECDQESTAEQLSRKESAREGDIELDSSGSQVSSPFETEAANMEAKAFSCRRECMVPARMLAEKRIRVLMIVYGVYSFISIGFQEVYPLWALSTVANGGLDWTTKDIGQVLSLVGMMMMIFQTCIYPFLLKKVGTRRIQHWASIVALPLYLTVPTLACLREHRLALVVSTTIVIFTANSCGNAIFVTVAVMTNNAVGPERRGELNGLAMMVGSLAKAMGPFFFSVIFAWSISTDRPFPFGPHLAFFIISAGMFVVATIGWNITQSDSVQEAAPTNKH